jgi:hypothetical protein
MLCDKYKEALIEAAASGAALPHALREHVQACEHCAAMLAGEQTLFAAVDARLQKAANAKVRPFFVPNVQANLATETVRMRNPIPAWALVCATAAVAVAAAFLSLSPGSHDKADRGVITVPSKVPAGADKLVLSVAPERKTRFSARAYQAPKQQNVSIDGSHEPEVLVQPEEEEFLKRFYAAMGNPAVDAKVVVSDDQEANPKSLVIERIEVRDLKIENLDEEPGIVQVDTK